MRYELYADSLWLLNFVLNLYILILANRGLLRTAARPRLLLAAAVGAGWYLVPFVLGGSALLKYGVSVAAAAGSMVWIAFRPASAAAWRSCILQLALWSFLLGGMLLAVMRVAPTAARAGMSMPGLAAAATAAFLCAGHAEKAADRARRNPACRVTLRLGEREVSADALVDSGNSLREPISGAPVSVLAEEVFRELTYGNEEKLTGFRMIPYHSIGREAGILKAWRIPSLRVDYHGCVMSVAGVYAAVSPELTGRVKMILNPEILVEGGS